MTGLVGDLLTLTDSELLAWRARLRLMPAMVGVGVRVAIVIGAMNKEDPGQIRKALYVGSMGIQGVARVRLAGSGKPVQIAFSRIWPIEELAAVDRAGIEARKAIAAARGARQESAELELPRGS